MNDFIELRLNLILCKELNNITHQMTKSRRLSVVDDIITILNPLDKMINCVDTVYICKMVINRPLLNYQLNQNCIH